VSSCALAHLRSASSHLAVTNASVGLGACPGLGLYLAVGLGASRLAVSSKSVLAKRSLEPVSRRMTVAGISPVPGTVISSAYSVRGSTFSASPSSSSLVWVESVFDNGEVGVHRLCNVGGQLHVIDRVGRGVADLRARNTCAMLAYFGEAGHAFRVKAGRCFARSWTVGAQRRRGFLFLLCLQVFGQTNF